MICVSIGRGRHKHVLAEHAHLVEEGAQLVELRLDYIAGEVNLKRLIDRAPGSRDHYLPPPRRRRQMARQ